jgi:NTP pyrophosphatase (non-canonical NTP hydrolase)
MHIPRAKCPDARPAFRGSSNIRRRAEASTERIVKEAIELAEWIVVEMNKGHDLVS